MDLTLIFVKATSHGDEADAPGLLQQWAWWAGSHRAKDNYNHCSNINSMVSQANKPGIFPKYKLDRLFKSISSLLSKVY